MPSGVSLRIVPFQHRATRSLAVVVVLLGGGCQQDTSTAHAPKTPQQTAGDVPISSGPQLIQTEPSFTPDVIPQFSDVANRSGIRFQRQNGIVPGRFFLPEIMGGGAAWFDFDADGLLDLYVVNGSTLPNENHQQTESVNRLFRNTGHGAFVDVSFESESRDGGYGQGCAVGDYDADGFPDLYVTNYGRNVLFHNNGDGSFEEIGTPAGVDDSAWGTSAVWADLDGDADLDLYVVNYLNVTLANHKVCEYGGKQGYCGPGSYEAQFDRVYLNQNNGEFVEAARELGFAIRNGKGLAVVAADFNSDRQPEIYVANDMAANFLFAVDDSAPASYRDVALEAGCAVSRDGKNEASMGIACDDFDGDGRIDIFLTHYFQAKNTLYRNRGDLFFDDESRRSKIAATSYEMLGFGTATFDYDRDGANDLFIANGHVLGAAHEPFAMPAQLLRNDGSGRFDDISLFAGAYFSDRHVGRGVAAGDYDNDGDVDLAVTHVDRPLALLRNDTKMPGRHFLGLKLVTANRVSPVGGRVVITAGEHRRMVSLTSGGSYLSSHDARVLVGLEDADALVNVEIEWPSGGSETFADLEVDRYWLINEGNTRRPLVLP